MNDAFSKCHPLVNFLFFVGAIVCGAILQHPAYVAVGTVCGAVYYVLLRRSKAVKPMALMLLLALVMTAVNPVFNTRGEHVLFHLLGRPYTQEALVYGAALSGVLLTMLLWLGCYNAVLTGDKFTALFGSILPAISLLLVMVLRMVPNLMRKTRQIVGARRCVGKGTMEDAPTGEKLRGGVTVLSAMTSWALEGSIVTADSMRSRGYGATRRSSFMIYRMTGTDALVLTVMVLLLAVVITAVCLGQAAVAFLPHLTAAPVSWGVCAYGAYLLLPAVLHGKEALQWRISRSGI
ncbi:MAG: hypothetical protein J6J83_00530 [Oscillospiraceae bacterium]|nr:hypothetical protein [Oscillospiraceae bacterium]